MLTSTESLDPLTAPHVLDVAFPAAAGGCAAQQQPVHIIPQGAEPRWIIVGDPRKALPVLRNWRAWNLSSRMRWGGVLFAASTRMLPRLPGVVNSRAALDSSYWRQSLEDFSDAWTAVIHVGNPSHTRKAIVFFTGADRQVKAVAKVPLAPAASAAILNEAAILDCVKRIEHLPRTLFQDAARGIAVQSWLEGKPISRALTEAHVDLLNLLVNTGTTTRVSNYRDEIAAQIDRADLPFEPSTLARALEWLDFAEPLPGFVEHRDFAPWNLKRHPDGRVVPLDWEWSVPNSLPWQDVCRFFYTEDSHFNGPGKVWEAMRSNRLLQGYVKRFGISPAALPALTMHYLLRVLCMDWQSGNTALANYSFRQIKLLLAAR